MPPISTPSEKSADGLGGHSSRISAERNNIEVRDLEISMESSTDQEGSDSFISSYFPFLFLISTVVTLLQYSKDQFATHPANMWISVAALLIFCLSHATMKKINQTEHGTKYSQIFDSFRVLSGALVVVSLLSIHLPHRLRWLFFLIWALLAVYIVARHFFKFKDTWIYTPVLSAGELMKQAILSAWNNISNRFTDQPNTVQGDRVSPV